MAHRYNSEEAARARRQRGGHASVRAEAARGIDTAARMRDARARRTQLRAALDGMDDWETAPLLDSHGRVDLQRQADQENGAAGMDYSNDILAGIEE